MIRGNILLRRGTALMALVAVVGLTVAACSDDDDGGGDASPTATATTAMTEVPSTPTQAASTPTATATSTPAASAAVQVSVSEDDTLGSYLVGPEGMTLYIFLRDEPGISNCSGQCLDAWPPLILEDGQEVEGGGDLPGEFDVIDTPSGSQVTYMGAPLYYWASDTAPGDTTGHDVGGVWYVARPDTASTAVINVQTEGELAPYLIGPNGMTLYLFTNDEPGVSNCSGGCAENWPPLVVPEGLDPTAVEGAPGELGVIEREDGLGRQVTYDGMPLYYWASDVLPGDTTGEGVNDVWFVVPPSGDAPAAATGPEAEGAAGGGYTY